MAIQLLPETTALHDYSFRVTWHLQAAVQDVYDAVVDVERYPSWWPDVRSVSKVDDETAELVCRSTLPFALVVRMRRVLDDPASGRMRVGLSGDLNGSLRATATRSGGVTRLDIAQDVVARKPLLRRFALVGRPVFRLNHAAMMRRGRLGLAAYLA